MIESRTQSRRRPLYGFAKRCLDVLVSSSMLVALAPLLVSIALLVRVMLGSPVLFVQSRPGLNGVTFRMLKFRTMRDSRDEHGALLGDEHRLTAFGSMLRSTSLDELPEFVNVLRGEMSLVGPRPLLVEYLPLYDRAQARRHEVRPGLTGWAQVNGRNAISWERKFELDVWYVDNATFGLDVRILALTFMRVVSRHGVNAQGRASGAPFTGSTRTNDQSSASDLDS
jgi:sugar transferase EpsL